MLKKYIVMIIFYKNYRYVFKIKLFDWPQTLTCLAVPYMIFGFEFLNLVVILVYQLLYFISARLQQINRYF